MNSVNPEMARIAFAGVGSGWPAGALAGATDAYGQAKRLARAAASRPFAASLTDEATTIGRAFDSADARSRVAAFVAARRH